MPAEQFLIRHLEADASNELHCRIREELAPRFAWPATFAATAARPLHDLASVVDLVRLKQIAARVHTKNTVSFTLISKEYLQTGLNWIRAAQNAHIANFLVVCGDHTTHTTLEASGIASVLADVDDRSFDLRFVSQVGFSAKGLAMTALKFPVARFLVASGYDVIFSDADAVWLQDPMPHVQDSDVAFQRIDYHPPAIATLWGFAACSGFIWFRSGPEVLAFLDRCIAEHRAFACDQIALNLALLQSNPEWHCDHEDWVPPRRTVPPDRTSLRAAFARVMRASITGILTQPGLSIRALPHDKFWRHHWIAGSLAEMVICHPNSPKDDAQKIAILDALGVRFAP